MHNGIGVRLLRIVRRSHVRTLSALCACILALSLLHAAALAQTTQLTALRAVPSSSGGAQIILSFSSGGLPAVKVYGDGTTSISVLLSGATRASNTPATISPAGPIVGGSITTVGDSLNLQLNLKGPATLHVAPGQGQTLVIDVPATAAAAPAAAGPEAPAQAPTPPPELIGGAAVPEVVRLHYADVSEVVGLLVAGANVPSNDTFQAQPSAGNFGTGPTVGGSLPNAGPGVGYAPPIPLGGGQVGSMAQRVSDNIAIDRRLNAIILTGPPDVVASLKALIAEVDVPLGSVMLETQIVELTDTAARDLGIDYANAAGQLATATYLSKGLQTAQGAVTLQAAVYAQVQRGNGRLIAQPRVLALDGTPASIITGDALPIVTSITISGVNATQQQVQYVNVGVNLQIQPRISSDGNVTAHVFCAVSSVSGYSQTYPQISQRQASTLATVKNGDSFVIGGLLEKSEINSLAKIPGIGDIPLIGGFFRVRHTSSSTTNLYIIVTPHVVSYGGAAGPGPQAPLPSPTPAAVPSASPSPR